MQDLTPILVLLHAYPLSSEMWEEDVRALGTLARVITPDFPGFGRSPRQPGMTIASMGRAVMETLDKQGIQEPVVVAGLSMGGYVALEILRQFPSRVRALGLLCTRAAADTPQQREGRLALVERIRKQGIDVVIDAALPKLLSASAATSKPQLVERVKTMIRRADPEAVVDALLAMASRADATPLLDRIKCPTLVVSAADDAVIPPAEAEAMAKKIRNSEYVMIPQAGHLANLEQPERFRAVLQQFLRTA